MWAKPTNVAPESKALLCVIYRKAVLSLLCSDKTPKALKRNLSVAFMGPIFALRATTAVEALRLRLKNPQGNNSLDLY
jgi:hypothetical protein